MIVCGDNDCGQLFIPRKKIVYPPEEVSKCQGFTFCVTGGYSSTAFFGLEPPPNFSNQIIEGIATKEKVKAKAETKKEKQEREIIKENEKLKKKLIEQEEEISKLKTQNKEYENRLKTIEKENNQLKKKSTQIEEENTTLKKTSIQIEEENSELKEELKQLKKKIKEHPDDSQKTQINNEFEILDVDTIKGLEKLEKISSNNNSKIMKVAKKVIYALKILKNEEITHKQLQHFIGEYEIMNALKHPNILKAYGIFYGDEENPASILLEYCPNNLYKAIKNKTLTKVERVCFIYEITSGMKFIHKNHIIHRDIKPSNILISKEGHIKITDFGISKLISTDEETMTTGIGTQKFMAPEIINEIEYDEKVDIYSFGVLIYFIISNGQMPKITITQVGNGKKAEIPNEFTEFSKEMIYSCWNFKPEDRPSFDKINSQMKDHAHELIEMTPTEIKEVQNFIKNHQQMIPEY